MLNQLLAYACAVCVCVCVCMREQEADSEGIATGKVPHCVPACVCVRFDLRTCSKSQTLLETFVRTHEAYYIDSTAISTDVQTWLDAARFGKGKRKELKGSRGGGEGTQ